VAATFFLVNTLSQPIRRSRITFQKLS
jgi:hypothetical protein